MAPHGNTSRPMIKPISPKCFPSGEQSSNVAEIGPTSETIWPLKPASLLTLSQRSPSARSRVDSKMIIQFVNLPPIGATVNGDRLNHRPHWHGRAQPITAWRQGRAIRNASSKSGRHFEKVISNKSLVVHNRKKQIAYQLQ